MTEHVSASAVPVSAAKGFSRQNKGEKKIMKNVNGIQWTNTVPWVKFFKLNFTSQLYKANAKILLSAIDNCLKPILEPLSSPYAKS